jgi:hypothetical protein
MATSPALRKYRNEQKRRYYKTTHGKAIKKFNNRRRRKRLKYFNLFENPFPPEEFDIEYHHINNLITVPIPKKMHIAARGYQHHKKCRKVIIDLYGFDVYELFKEIKNETTSSI